MPNATTKREGFFCRRCLHFCNREDSYKEHIDRCQKKDAQKTLFPKKNDKKGKDKVKFNNIERQLPLPFYFTADFEAILKKQAEEENEDIILNEKCSCGSTNLTLKCQDCKSWKYCSELCKEKHREEHKKDCIEASKDTNYSYSKKIDHHIPCGACYKLTSTDPDFYRDPVIITHQTNDGKSVAEKFLDSILHDARELRKMLKYKKPMVSLTKREQAAYNSRHASCIICKKVSDSIIFFVKNVYRVDNIV